MKKRLTLAIVFSGIFLCFPLIAGERTIPVDMVIMIDKSISMDEPGKYDSLHAWVRDQLIGQMVIDGDWISLYQFYGRADRLLTLTVNGENDRNKIISTIDAIKPNGQYTDIGFALDTMAKATETRGENGRHKILLLLTDRKQEAPDSSRYAGVSDNYDSPYLAEARVVKHDAWYEITVDMGIKAKVEKETKELYSSIESGESGKNREKIVQDIEGSESGERVATDGTQGSNGATATGNKAAGAQTGGTVGGLPLPAILVVSSLLVGAGIAATAIVLNVRRKKKEETEPQQPA